MLQRDKIISVRTHELICRNRSVTCGIEELNSKNLSSRRSLKSCDLTVCVNRCLCFVFNCFNEPKELDASDDCWIKIL